MEIEHNWPQPESLCVAVERGAAMVFYHPRSPS
jgi:hypothetical protein